jgi:hypothetical protein
MSTAKQRPEPTPFFAQPAAGQGPEVAELLLRPLPCLLCGLPPHIGAVFIPHDQRGVAAPPGKVRAIRYSLCRRCFRKPRCRERSERQILAELAAVNRLN